MWFVGCAVLCMICTLLGFVVGRMLVETCTLADSATINSLESENEALKIENATLKKRLSEEQSEKALVSKAAAKAQESQHELLWKLNEYRQKAAELGELVTTDMSWR